MAANRQIIMVQTFFAGVATFVTAALFHTAQPDGTKTVGATLYIARAEEHDQARRDAGAVMNRLSGS
jgi:hypothetical protein